MGNPAIFSGRRTKLLTADGLLRSNGGVNDHDGTQNFILNGHAEVDNLLWATYANTAQATPVNGTGGAPAVTFTRSTTTPLAGQGSFLFTKDAVNRQGNGASYAFTINAKDKAKVLQISFDYLVSSGTFVAGSAADVTVWIYDVTNSVLISPSSINLLSNSTTIADKFNATFQTSSNSTSYRLILHCATVSASAYVLQMKNFTVSPSTYVYGTPVTDPVAYTPTITGFGTATAVNFVSWKDGAYLNVEGTFTAGTNTAVEAQISLGFGGVNANVTTSSTLPTLSVVGRMKGGTASATFFATATVTAEASKTYLTLSVDSSTVSLAKSLGTAFTNTVVYSFSARVPIQGWSSSVQTADQTDTRVVSFLGYPSSNQTLTMAVTNLPLTARRDTHGAWTGSTFVVPVAGDYQFSLHMVYSAAISNNMAIFKNTVNTRRLATSYAGVIVMGSATIENLVVGDVISIRSPDAGCTINSDANSFLSIARISGPSAIAATESINARYFASATTISGTLALVNWTTKDYDSHGGMSAGSYTVQAPGKYHVDAAILIAGTIALNTTAIMEIQKNGTVVTRNTEYSGGAMTNQKAWASDLISCVAGDILTIKVSSSATTPTIVSSNFDNYVSIFRAGN